MKTTKRFILTLAAILGMTGAWAQDAEEVAVKDGTEDATNWTITPSTATAGETVTVTYSGTKKVKSVKAKKK